jgi:hypothetical protein
MTITPIVSAQSLEDRISNLIAAGEVSYGDSKAELMRIEQLPGKRYIKLICTHYRKDDMRKSHGSVWCFIDKETGEVYKPASFKAPAKHVRYRLMDDKSYQDALSRADWAGGWLYIR